MAGGAVNMHVEKGRRKNSSGEVVNVRRGGQLGRSTRCDVEDAAVLDHDHRVVLQMRSIPQVCCCVYRTHEG